MNIAIGILTALQFLIAMLFCPIKLGVCGHASLAHDKLELNVTVLNIPLARIRVKKENGGFKAQINGKRLRPAKKKQKKNLPSLTKLSELKIAGSLIALIGTQDARATAMMCAGITAIVSPIIKDFRIFTAKPSDTLEIDGRMNTTLNIMQIAELIFAGLGEDDG